MQLWIYSINTGYFEYSISNRCIYFRLEFNPLIISVTVAIVCCGKLWFLNPPGFRNSDTGRSKQGECFAAKQMSLTIMSRAQTWGPTLFMMLRCMLYIINWMHLKLLQQEVAPPIYQLDSLSRYIKSEFNSIAVYLWIFEMQCQQAYYLIAWLSSA